MLGGWYWRVADCQLVEVVVGDKDIFIFIMYMYNACGYIHVYLATVLKDSQSPLIVQAPHAQFGNLHLSDT